MDRGFEIPWVGGCKNTMGRGFNKPLVGGLTSKIGFRQVKNMIEFV
jgi:hypothetical protein